MTQAEVQLLIDNESAKCQLDVHGRISALASQLEASDKIRNQMNTKLDKIDFQSQANHKAIGEYHKNQKALTTSIKDLTDTVKDLIDRTSDNTAFVQSETFNRKINDAAKLLAAKDKREEREAQAIIDANKFHVGGYIDKAIPSLIVVVVLGLSSLVWIGVTTKVGNNIEKKGILREK